jgi:hypothetical protein
MPDTATTSRNDGKRLEKKFAAWLKGVQGFERVELNHRVNGAVSTEVYEVDVLGKRDRGFLPVVTALGFILMIGLFPLLLIISVINDGMPGIWFAYLWFGSFCAFIIGAHFDTISVWAECKDVEKGVAREHVAVLKHNVEDVRKKKIGWKPTHVYMVTANRFEQNALRLALSYGFRCYEETENGFREAIRPIT